MGTVTKTGTLSADVTSHDTTNYSYASVNTSYPISNAYHGSSNTTYGQVNWKTGSGAETYVYLRFNLSAIPANATITSVTAKAKGYVNTTNSSRVTTRQMQLASGTTLKGSALTLSTSTTEQTFSSTGSWTRAELQSAGVRFYVKRGTSNTNSNYTLRMYGASITVNYSYQETTYTITVNNNSSATVSVEPDSTVVAGEDCYIKSDTISGITITDNNTDVTNQFVQTTDPSTGSYTVNNVGSYGFTLSNNYYTSNNKGISKSAAVCRVDFSMPAAGTVTFTYINYAEQGYDFGVFGNIDVALSNDYYAAGSNGATITDSSYARACNTSSYNSSSTQTLTYNMTAGEHSIWVKYSKDDASDSNNDTLQFRISITLDSSYTPGTYYRYDITNVQTDHTIVVSDSSPVIISVTGVDVSPATASIEIGATTTLTATVSPSNATNKSVTWSTSASSVATVSNGVVTGVSAGTARITATTADGGFTDYCDVTVTAVVTYDFVPASSMQPGKSYLISNGNSGTVYLLTDESGGSRTLVGVAVTVSNGKITLNSATRDRVLFNCVQYTSGNDVTNTVEKNNKYLYSDSATGLRMNAPTTLNRFWHYRDNKFWSFKSTTTDGYTDTSSEYKYYLTWSNGNATDNHVTSPSIQDTDIPLTYIWKEDDGTSDAIYYKNNNSWVAATSVYKKINGSWVQQTDLTSVFDSNTNYVKGG